MRHAVRQQGVTGEHIKPYVPVKLVRTCTTEAGSTCMTEAESYNVPGTGTIINCIQYWYMWYSIEYIQCTLPYRYCVQYSCTLIVRWRMESYS